MSSRSAAEIIVDGGRPFAAADGARAAAFLEVARLGGFLSGFLLIDVSSRGAFEEQVACCFNMRGADVSVSGSSERRKRSRSEAPTESNLWLT
jgi:hypothetical protein